jgi:hypothetical protein
MIWGVCRLAARQYCHWCRFSAALYIYSALDFEIWILLIVPPCLPFPNFQWMLALSHSFNFSDRGWPASTGVVLPAIMTRVLLQRSCHCLIFTVLKKRPQIKVLRYQFWATVWISTLQHPQFEIFWQWKRAQRWFSSWTRPDIVVRILGNPWPVSTAPT